MNTKIYYYLYKTFTVDNIELENEIEMRMNPEDFSLSSRALIDIMNQFNKNEHDVALAYSMVVEKRRDELRNIAKDVADYFRSKGNHYPSFNEFKKRFERYQVYIDDKILRDMHKKEIKDENQAALFEIKKMIREEFRAMSEMDDEFEKDAAAITKNWGGEIKKAPDAKLSVDDTDDLFDAGAIAQQDIESEFGKDEFTPMDDDEYKNVMGIDEDNVGNQGMFKPQDSNGKGMKLKGIVTNLDGTKTGRILGFGDDGKGNLTVRVMWAWPVDMKFTNPGEMGEKAELPANLIAKGMNEAMGSRFNNPDYANDYDNADNQWQDEFDKDFDTDMDYKHRGRIKPDLAVQDMDDELDTLDDLGLGESGRGNLRGVEVTYADGTTIPTSMAAGLSDEDINNYFKVGRMFNIGNVEDNMQAVQSVNIIRENMNENLNEEKTCKECGGEVKGVKAGDEIIDVCDECGAKESGIKKENKMNENLNENAEINAADIAVYNAIMQFHNVGGNREAAQRHLNSAFGAEGIGEARGLGHSVKNTGDRNVKKDSENHSHAPVTTLNEKIKTLSEGSVKKKDLLSFINKEAKNLAKDIRDEENE